MNSSLLSVEDLHVHFKTPKGVVKAVDGVDFSIEKGKVLGLAGESGSGKSITSLAIMNLVPQPNGYVPKGKILFRDQSILELSQKQMASIRGKNIAMIFQEPMTSLNPVFKIGDQIGESLKIHQGLVGAENRKKAIEMLQMVKIPRAESIIDEYPHQLSGGMRQRVVIAIALSCNPALLIADEPTTALDVTIQAQILNLMKELTKQLDTAILFITHDLGVLAEMADEIAIMYCGKIVEKSDVNHILSRPNHPYTQGLIRSRPENFTKENGFYAIGGRVPSPHQMPLGCAFEPRCDWRMAKCKNQKPEIVPYEKDRYARCFYCQQVEKGDSHV